MNKLLIICLLPFVLVITSGPVFPMSYEFDFNGDGVWDTEWNLVSTYGEKVAVEVWLDGYSCTPNDLIFGAELYFYYDHTRIQVNETNSYPNDSLHGGPFDPPPICFFKHLEDGVYALTVGAFNSFAPVIGNKIKLGVIELECIGDGDAFIKAGSDIGFGGYTDGFIADCNLDIQYPDQALATVHQAPPSCTENIQPQHATISSNFPPIVGPAFTVSATGACEPLLPVYSDDCISADVNPATGVLNTYCGHGPSENCHVFAADNANPDACSLGDCTADVHIDTLCCPNDMDTDRIANDNDNCPYSGNSLWYGTCVKTINGVVMGTGMSCLDNSTCEAGEVCQMEQGDINSNGIGDVCECYADLNDSGKVNSGDLLIMKIEYNRNDCYENPCDADCNDDGNVNSNDLLIMKMQYNKNDCPGSVPLYYSASGC